MHTLLALALALTILTGWRPPCTYKIRCVPGTTPTFQWIAGPTGRGGYICGCIGDYSPRAQ